jgi:iron complex transport system substrate-binding protein
MEQILSLNPDVILAKPFTELDNMSESMGIPAVCITQESVQELKDSYTLIGQVMGKEDEADSILAYFTEKEQYILDRTSQITESARLRVFITGVDPMSTIGGDAYQEYLISTAGGINVASSISGFGTAVSMEQIILWNPDVVLVVSYCKSTAGDISSNAQWQSVKAVKEGSVYDFPTFMGPWDAPGSKSIIGMIWLANILYPDEIGFDINQEIKDYYQTVYRYEISDEEIADILKPR